MNIKKWIFSLCLILLVGTAACQSNRLGQPCSSRNDCAQCLADENGAEACVNPNLYCYLLDEDEWEENGAHGQCREMTDTIRAGIADRLVMNTHIVDTESYQIFKDLVDGSGVVHWDSPHVISFSGEQFLDEEGNPLNLEIESLETVWVLRVEQTNFSSVSFPGLRRATLGDALDEERRGELLIQSNPDLREVNLEVLNSGSHVSITDNDLLERISFSDELCEGDLCRRFRLGNVVISGNRSLEDLNIARMREVRSLHITENESLAGIHLNQLQAIGVNEGFGVIFVRSEEEGMLVIEENPSLLHFSMGQGFELERRVNGGVVLFDRDLITITDNFIKISKNISLQDIVMDTLVFVGFERFFDENWDIHVRAGTEAIIIKDNVSLQQVSMENLSAAKHLAISGNASLNVCNPNAFTREACPLALFSDVHQIENNMPCAEDVE